jgi:hypothetical protein
LSSFRDIVGQRPTGNKVSRAAFLKACGVALLGVGVGAHDHLSDTAARPAGTEHAPADGNFPLCHGADRFREHLSTAFFVRSADGTRERMVLSKILERPLAKNVEQFSLIFHARAGTSFPQGTHAFCHEALGDFDWFIVPINAPNGHRTIYEACFSRHLSADDVGRGPGATASLRRRT